MKITSTIKKGNELEDVIFKILSSDIENGFFWAPSACCKIFQKKGYYSKDREKNIIFDISIEVFLPGKDAYSLLVLVECKNYNHKVPVDDVEEFYSKVQQVSGANIKAVVASSDALQDGAFKFSKSKGIGFLRYFSEKNSEWVLTRSPSCIGRSVKETEHASISQAILQQDFVGKGFEFYCFNGIDFTNSIHYFFERLMLSDVPESQIGQFKKIRTDILIPRSSVSYVDFSFIESKSNELLKLIGYFNGFVRDDKLVDVAKEKYGLSLDLGAELPLGVLGTVDFQRNAICVDSNQCGTKERARFTLAHELGHFILGHSKYIERERCYNSHLSESRDDISIKDIMRLEWQANQFASCVLLPKKAFVNAFIEQANVRGIKNRGFGALYVDEQRCNISALNLVTASLMKQFNVSKTVIVIRLKQLGIIRERFPK
ncbi:ImmA/IrrE family metallo-endopeptidase [Rheinheimera aquimaris]|uniref:ImmA/IrrE family metallo-endopeptidase n=1 Tax=Rheinheimera aquimaris TaxID=412437 RepID=A0ABN1DZU1_9GAMM|nr:ImmA/IrrE family metallo-endopeptidase [Rheinheimera aquimaris]MCB5214899.1 ImmA/IrrE family metallo-endopeptidase [Rheinheimera aquimaris]